MDETVLCRSDSTYAERPLALLWQGRRYEIIEILARWRTPQGRGFRVQTETGQGFVILFDEAKQTWEIQLI
jgi:hypothetical protein